MSTFVAELRSIAKGCEFGAALEDNLRDRLVCGINNEAIQKALLSEKNLTFRTAYELAQSHESAVKNVVTLLDSGHSQLQLELHKLQSSAAPSRSCYRCGQDIVMNTVDSDNRHAITVGRWGMSLLFVEVGYPRRR